MNGKAETIGGAFIAALIGFLTGFLALLSQDGVSTINDIGQIAWIVLAVGALIAFGKDFQALSYRRWQAKLTSSGNVHMPVFVMIIALLLTAGSMSGCAGTRAAYEAAEGMDEIAFVTRDHWYALVNEANEARRSGELTGEPLDRAQDIVRGARPIIDELDTIRRQWQTLKNASTEADLQAAIAAAAANVARLLIIVRGPRPEASLLFNGIEQDLKRWSEEYSFMPSPVAVAAY